MASDPNRKFAYAYTHQLHLSQLVLRTAYIVACRDVFSGLATLDFLFHTHTHGNAS